MSGAISRRRLLGGAAAASAVPATGPEPLRIAIMSKFLQFLGLPEMADAAKSLGFDGIDLCVRPGGHVLPERVREDLPRVVETIRKTGLDVPMITAAIIDDRSQHAHAILETACRLGIRYYRWGGFNYTAETGIAGRLDALRPRVKALSELNRGYGMCAMYHTHSGPNQVGASIWDLWLLLKDFDSQWVAANLDIGHATVEGGYGGWIHATRLILPFTRGVAIKDFRWEQNVRGEWRPRWCPIGEGMVDYKRYLPMLKAAGFAGPVQMHFEYPLGGVENGTRKLTMPREDAFAAMRRDLMRLRGWFAEHRL